MSSDQLILSGTSDFLYQATSSLKIVPTGIVEWDNAMSEFAERDSYSYYPRQMQLQQQQQTEQDRKLRVLKRFVVDFLNNSWNEFHDLLCVKGRLLSVFKEGGSNANSIGTMLGVTLATSFGFTNPLAIGLSAIVLSIVVKSTTKAFCDLVRDEVVSAVKEVRLIKG